ncbi:hypothetical protein Q7P35_008364 [Cladosporium inversicolor]
MTQEVQVHVVSKTNSLDHRTVTINTSHLPALAPNNIRVQTRLVSLTANNLTYARLGSLAKWWDAFPVSPFLPPPYNDTTTYGIVPVWGYAQILETQIAGLDVGMLLYGFWPSSTLPIDLQLTPTEPIGHYIDTTPHRQTMWSYYHRYTLAPTSLDLNSPSLAAEIVFKPLFECAHSLNAYVLGPLAIHPAPKTSSCPTWPHADLTNTTVISLSASGKTARAFNDAVLNTRAAATGPEAFVAITSNPDTFSFPAQTPPPPSSKESTLNDNENENEIKTRTLCYEAALSPSLPSLILTLSSPPPSKILIADFGARANSLPLLLSNLRAYLPPTTSIAIVGIGAEPTPLTSPSDLTAALAGLAAVTERVQMNTSEVREAVIKAVGAETYFGGVEAGWRGFCERGGCAGVKVVVGRGVGSGSGGLEEGWGRLCAGEADGVGGLTFLL